MIVLLFLIPSLVVGVVLPEIDWTTCEQDTRCIAPKRCVKEEGDSDLLIELSTSEDLKESQRCDVGLQNKYLTDDITLFQLQVLGDATPLGEGSKIALFRGTTELFGCELRSGIVNITGNAELIKNYRIKLFEDRSRFVANHVFCAVTVDKFKKFNVKKLNKLLNNGEHTFMKLINGAKTTEYHYKYESLLPYQLKVEEKCDVYSFNEKLTNADYHILPVKNRDKNSMNCENYGPLYKMKYDNTTVQDYDMNELKCIGNSNDGFHFEIVGDGFEQAVEEPESYSFYCAAPINEVCSNPFRRCTTSDCPNHLPGSAGTPAKLTCADKKWLIGGKYYVLREEPICKQDIYNNQNEAAFYTKSNNGEENKTDTERCFTDYDCKEFSNLDYPKCRDDAECDEIDYSDGIMKCKDEKKQLRVINFSLNETQFAQNFTCDKTTGLWRNRTNGVLAERSQVRCFVEETYIPTQAKLSGEMLGWIIGGILFAGILLAAIILAVMYCCYYLKTSFHVKGDMQWKHMSAGDKLEHCKLVFGEASQSTPDTKIHIVHGLSLLSVLLDTETTEPDIWEEAYRFIIRIQWTLEKLDHNICHMFSRYLYLQAKAIIDKQGWLSPKQITTRTDKGLMRAVAIQLLSFIFYNWKVADEARELLECGFRKLGFRCVEQYPHCGLMWSAMVNLRTNTTELDDTAKAGGGLNRRMVLEHLTQIAKGMNEFEMPKEDVIPEFGTPESQAIEAIGGAPDLEYNEDHDTDYIADDLDGPRALTYFTGMGFSLLRNPAAMLFPVLKMNSGKKEAETQLRMMHSIAAEGEWTAIAERIMKLMVYYGKDLDSKKLQTIFAPSVSQPSQLCNQLNMDQQFFEEAAEAQKEELRRWLAARTDKKELKKKPEYTRNPAQDARINKGKEAQAKPPVDAAAAAATPTDPHTPNAAAAAAVEAPSPVAATTPTDPAAKPAASSTSKKNKQ